MRRPRLKGLSGYEDDSWRAAARFGAWSRLNLTVRARSLQGLGAEEKVFHSTECCTQRTRIPGRF